MKSQITLKKKNGVTMFLGTFRDSKKGGNNFKEAADVIVQL